MAKRTSKETRDNAEKLANLLAEGFLWEATKEGDNFWGDIYNRLMRIAEKGR
jgi:hypothetical protein